MINQGNNINLVKSSQKICVFRKNYVPLHPLNSKTIGI